MNQLDLGGAHTDLGRARETTHHARYRLIPLRIVWRSHATARTTVPGRPV